MESQSGNGNGRHDHEPVHPADAEHLAASRSNDGDTARDLEHEILFLQHQVAELKAGNAAIVRAVAMVAATVDEVLKFVHATHKAIDTLFKSLLEDNRRLRDGLIEDYGVRIAIDGLILIVDRQSQDISQEVFEFSALESCRSADRAEALEIMSLLGYEDFSCPVGLPFDPATQEVRQTRESSHPQKLGRVASVLRWGYRRRRDGAIHRKVGVEVFVARRSR